MRSVVRLVLLNARLLSTSILLLILLYVALFGNAFAAERDWLAKVPARDHDRVNPYKLQKEAVLAGHRVFLERCAQCHGQNAEGRERRPSLKSDRIQSGATDGDLHWLLVNGNMKKGMPSWAKLPDQQLWQVISYIKSLHD
jgi:mono/diheme cytochrome c family protein